MNVSLTPQLEDLIRKKVATGMYNSSSEVVREALRLLDERDRIHQMRLEELRKDIQLGLDQLDRGESINGDEAIAQLRERIRQIRVQSG